MPRDSRQQGRQPQHERCPENACCPSDGLSEQVAQQQRLLLGRADRVLDNAVLYDSLSAAIGDCSFVLATAASESCRTSAPPRICSASSKS